MPAMPIDTLQSRLEELSNYDPIALQNAKLEDLRRLSRGIVLDNHKLRKPELLEAIAEATRETRKRLGRVEEPVEVADEGTPVARAEQLYKALRDIATTSSTFEEQTDRITRLFAAHSRYEGATYAPSSIKSNGTVIKQTLASHLATETDKYQREVGTAIAQFVRMYSSWLSGYTEAENKAYKARIASRQNDLTELTGLPAMITHAKEVLKAPSGYHWTEVSKAIALATGRRLSEVHFSAEFTPIDSNSIRFKGQLKTKNRQDVPESWVIPCLLDSQLVTQALDHLGVIGRRYESAEVAEKKCSKPLSRSMEAYPELSYKSLRDIYGLLCSKLYWKSEEHSGRTLNAYLAGILGHSEADVTTANSYQKYRSDEVQEALGALG